MMRNSSPPPQDWEENKNILARNSHPALYCKSYLVNKTRKGNRSSVDWKRNNMLLFIENMILNKY